MSDFANSFFVNLRIEKVKCWQNWSYYHFKLWVSFRDSGLHLIPSVILLDFEGGNIHLLLFYSQEHTIMVVSHKQ